MATASVSCEAARAMCARDPHAQARSELFQAAVAALEVRLGALGAPSTASKRRRVDHVLADGLMLRQIQPALDDLADGAGGELRGDPSPFCSTKSSAALAVNTFAP